MRSYGGGLGLDYEHVFDALSVAGLERDHLPLPSRMATLMPRRPSVGGGETSAGA